MGEIFAPAFAEHHKFSTRKKGKAETPLAYHATLLASAKVTFPGMDQVGRNFLVLEKLLSWAKDLQVIIPAMEDRDIASLKVARCLEAHLHIRQRGGVVGGTAPPAEEGATTGGPHLQAGVLSPAAPWRNSGEDLRGRRDGPVSFSPRQKDGPVVCFKCGLPGHVYIGCLA
ncbi:unnamed protein product [Lampetra fluviatilis]